MRVLALIAGVLVAFCATNLAEANPDSVAKVRVAADNAFAGGDMKTAITLLSKLIELEPRNERNFYKRFRAYLSERKYSHALSDLSSSLDVNPKYKQGRLQRGKLLMMLGQCAEASQDFQTVVELYPKEATGAEQLDKSKECASNIDEAERAHTRGDYQSAYNYLTQVLEGSAISSVPLLLERAQLSVSLQNPYDAIADLGSILKLDPSNLIALQKRGEVLYSLGDKQSLEAAQSHYRQGLHSDPEHKGIKSLYRRLKKVLKYVNRAEDAQQRGAHREAVAEWQSALEVDADHSAMNKEFSLQLCSSELHLKHFKQARDACEKTVAIDNGYALAFAKLSEAQIGLELYEDAVRSANRAAELEDSREFKEKSGSGGGRFEADAGIPDKHTDKDESEREEVEKKFHDIAEAYEILSNEETRAMYDRGEDVTGNPQQQQQRGNPFNNAHFFQQGGRTFHFNFGG
ncbi:DnaJ domain [Phytophthora infestans]|uniref:DnaJ domain n=1 Tax=Phytophthora infestans TaxID=4787 RepID=A0A833WH03_PHYIN|nr:DnaJ domain [Phytophthora infestans]